MQHQTTLARAAAYTGIGLHSGREVHMELRPAAAGTGIVFVRTDMDGEPRVHATADHVTSTLRATTIEEDGVKFFTIEHLMSALHAQRIDNCEVRLDSEEAMPFLSESLVENTVRIIRTVFGYINVFFQKKDYASAKAVLNFGLALSNGLRRDGETNFTDKTSGMLWACFAYSELMDGNAVGAEKALLQAKLTAERFDANPNYSAAAIRFVSCDESASAYDDIGATAAEGVRNTVCSLESAELTKICEDGNHARAAPLHLQNWRMRKETYENGHSV